MYAILHKRYLSDSKLLLTDTHITVFMVINIRLVYKIISNLPYSVSCYLNVRFIHSTILDYLIAFQVINETETLIVNKSFCFKTNMP